MHTVGIGVDIVKNQRIKKVLKNKAFMKRIYSSKELSISKNKNDKVNYFAKRFAAKEAFVKALGTGFRNNVNFKDIIVINDSYGKPQFKISNKINSLLKKKFKSKNFKFYLSLSDEKKHSIAFVIIEKKYV